MVNFLYALLHLHAPQRPAPAKCSHRHYGQDLRPPICDVIHISRQHHLAPPVLTSKKRICTYILHTPRHIHLLYRPASAECPPAYALNTISHPHPLQPLASTERTETYLPHARHLHLRNPPAPVERIIPHSPHPLRQHHLPALHRVTVHHRAVPHVVHHSVPLPVPPVFSCQHYLHPALTLFYLAEVNILHTCRHIYLSHPRSIQHILKVYALHPLAYLHAPHGPATEKGIISYIPHAPRQPHAHYVVAV